MAGGAIARGSLGLAAAAEQAEIAFGTILKDGEKTKALLAELNTFSVKTPFEPAEVRRAGQSLLAFRSTAEELPEILQFLGDASAGTGSELSELTRVFNKVKSTGKLTGETFEQFAERGVNIRAVLGDMLGKTGDEMVKMQSKGEISFDLVVKAFRQMTGEGGIFFKAMERQSTSFNGLMSTAKGVVAQVGTALGNQLLPPAKQVLTTFINLVNRVIDWNTATDGMVARVSAIVGGLASITAAMVGMSVAAKALGFSITGLIRSLTLGLATSPALPFVAATVAIGGMITGLVKLVGWLATQQTVIKAWEESLMRLKLAWQNIQQAAKAVLDSLKQALNNVIGLINDRFGTSLSQMKGGFIDAVAAMLTSFTSFVLDASEWTLVLANKFDTAWELMKTNARIGALFMRDLFFQLPKFWGFAWGLMQRMTIEAIKKIIGFVVRLVTSIAEVLVNFFKRTGFLIAQAIKGKDITKALGDQIKATVGQMTEGFKAGLELKDPRDLFVASDELKAASKRAMELRDTLFEAKDALEAGRDARIAELKAPAAPTAAPRRVEASFETAKIKKMEFPRGSFGISELNKQIQAAELKALDPAKKTAANTSIIAENTRRQTGLLEDIKDDTPAVATG